MRHRRATPPEARDDRVKQPEVIRAETRSRVRVLFKSYSLLALLWVLPVAFVLGSAEAIGLMVTGRFRRGLAVLITDLYDHKGFEKGINALRYAKFEPFVLHIVDETDRRPELRGDVRPFGDERARAGDITIFHFALPSPMTEAFASLRRARVLQYHNITPASFFAPYDPQLFRLAACGRRELRSLVGRVDLALGDSEFNRRELEELGFDRTAVFPIAVNLARLTVAPRRPALEKILADVKAAAVSRDRRRSAAS